MLITQGLSISDITYFSKLFESKCSLHIAYTICILLVPQLVQLKHFHNIHVSISCSRNNAMCSVKSLLSWTHRKNTFSSPFSIILASQYCVCPLECGWHGWSHLQACSPTFHLLLRLHPLFSVHMVRHTGLPKSRSPWCKKPVFRVTAQNKALPRPYRKWRRHLYFVKPIIFGGHMSQKLMLIIFTIPQSLIWCLGRNILFQTPIILWPTHTILLITFYLSFK